MTLIEVFYNIERGFNIVFIQKLSSNCLLIVRVIK